MHWHNTIRWALCSRITAGNLTHVSIDGPEQPAGALLAKLRYMQFVSCIGIIDSRRRRSVLACVRSVHVARRENY